ncbi:MAG: hypothetical protein ABIN91_21405 [Mucilaginibacter sp.]|uniref:hypothetical protein n=1 Tax=Mucilaginibacter sp. TaxID=1882438 RepID=UPI00326799ED
MESNSSTYQSYNISAITKIVEKSAIFGDFPIREIYLSALVNRLSGIPQLLPINSFENTRNRYDHVKNMINILDTLSKLDYNKNVFDESFWKDVAMGIIMHDIGHTPYGHAGERAIEKYLGNERKFSNSIQSERLLFHRYSSIGQITNKGNIFDTLPIKPFIRFKDHRLDCNVSVLVDFIDDLENAVGDLQDLWFAFGDHRVKKLFKHHFYQSNIEDNVSKIGLEYLFCKCNKLNMNYLCERILLDFNEIHTELKYLKKQIRLFSEMYECIALYDTAGEKIVSEILYHTDNMLRSEYAFCDEDIKGVTSDIVASMTLLDIDENIA